MMKILSACALSLACTFGVAGESSGSAVDVHAHMILPEYVAFLKDHGAEMEEMFPLPAWDAASHIRFMEKAGIECSVLTMPAPQPWFGDAEEGRKIARRFNEAAAQLKATYPGKFKFCASLPLPDVQGAIEEAVYALDVLHADGVKLASNSRGQYLGDAALDPLMEELDKRNAVIIVHPHRPTPFSEETTAITPLAMYEYPAETTRAIVNMISRNVLARYPNVKVVVPHCGSFLPLAVPRMRSIHPAMQAKGLMAPIDWEGNLSRLYYDLAGNPSPEVLQALLTITSPDHLLYGSDFPYQPVSVLSGNLQRLQKSLEANEQLAPLAKNILRGNAHKLFSSNAGGDGKDREKTPTREERHSSRQSEKQHPAPVTGAASLPAASPGEHTPITNQQLKQHE